MAKTQRKMQRKSNRDKINEKRKLIANSIVYFRERPDVFCEDILEIKLNLYQRVTLRAFFNSKYSIWIWSRGLGKTWLGALALCIFGMLYKNTLIGVVAPSFRQSKVLVQDKIIKDLMDRSPFLKSEILKTIVSQAEATVEFYNGSRIMAIPTGDGSKIRGYRFHVIMADEYAQIPSEILDLVINPMMNVKQGYEVGKEDYENEIGNRLLVTSSAYYKHNHLYKLFKQYVEEVAIDNDKYYVSVYDYQVGLDVGLFDDDHIEKEKKRLSPLDFDMEYGCVFPNLSENAWISPVDLQECSTIKNIEVKGVNGYRYIMSLDVARVAGNDNTAMHVVKLVPRKGYFLKMLVYTKTLNGMKFEHQNKEVRDILKKFPDVEKIFMDTSGLGVGLADELSKPYWDVEEQKEYPPLIDMNDEQAVKDIVNGIPLIYGIKPSAEANHKMGMAVKKDTQKKYLRLYSMDAGDDKGTDLTLDEEMVVLEAEATRREVMRIEAKPQGMYLRFQSVIRKGEESRKDRWSALGLVLYGAEMLEAEMARPEKSLCVGVATSRG